MHLMEEVSKIEGLFLNGTWRWFGWMTTSRGLWYAWLLKILRFMNFLLICIMWFSSNCGKIRCAFNLLWQGLLLTFWYLALGMCTLMHLLLLLRMIWFFTAFCLVWWILHWWSLTSFYMLLIFKKILFVSCSSLSL